MKYAGWDRERGEGRGPILSPILTSYRSLNPLKSEARSKSPPMGKRVKFDAYSREGLGNKFFSIR